MDIWNNSIFYLDYFTSIIRDYLWPEDDFEFILLEYSPHELTLI